MVYATLVITILSYLVWLHHFFTMGSGASVNSFFGITTMVISIPTGAKLFNWLFTMYRGRIRFELPMMWTVAFMLTFTIGGMTGVLLAVPPADFVLHNSLFLIAHFHNVIIGGVLFGIFAAINYWWPKAFGFKLNQFWGKVSFWLLGPRLLVRLHAALHARPDGRDPPHARVRRSAACRSGSSSPRFGAVLIARGIGAMLVQFAVFDLEARGTARRDAAIRGTAVRWNGRPRSPPPEYNFAFTPIVHDIDAWDDMKRAASSVRPTGFRPIHMPKSTGTGVILAGLSTAFGFAMIWYIWWLAAVSFVGILGYRDLPYLQLQARLPHPGRDGRSRPKRRATRQLAAAGA